MGSQLFVLPLPFLSKTKKETPCLKRDCHLREPRREFWDRSRAVYQRASSTALAGRSAYGSIPPSYLCSSVPSNACAAAMARSLMAYSVQQRKQEIGAHMALGASPHQVRRMVVIQGMKVALVGVILGAGPSRSRAS